MVSKNAMRDMTPAQFFALQKRSRIAPLEHRDGPLALSFAQQRLWFMAQLEGASAAYHIPLALRLSGQLDPVALQAALQGVVARHEALRTSFVASTGEPEQRIAAADTAVQWHLHDWRDQADAEARLARLTEAMAREPFDLERGPLLRAGLALLDDRTQVLLLTLHHLIADGWSLDLLLREWGQLYGAFSQGRSEVLAPLPIQYADYAAWQRQWLSGDVLAQQRAYWRDTLAGAPTLLALPTDRPRPAQQDYRGGFVALQLDPELSARLKAISLAQGSTLFITVLAAWALLLTRLCGQTEVLIGTPSANRARSETQGLIGLFVNTLALRLDASAAPTVASLLEQARAVALGAQEHQDLPFEQVVELLNPPRSTAHTPLVQAMFAWENDDPASLSWPGLELQRLASGEPMAKFDLTLVLGERDGIVSGGLEYATALFDAATVARFGEYLRVLLQQMLEQPQAPLASLQLLGTDEREQLLVTLNRTELAYAQAPAVQCLIEAQVRRDPAATALVFQQARLSYGELNAAANRLAHHLRELGVGPDVRVALCFERSLAMVVGLLAVLKAGGAYVPLDPAHPPARLGHLLADSAPRLVLTHGPARAALAAALQGSVEAPPLLDLDADAGSWAGASPDDLAPEQIGLTPGHLAYVIYTSGSTGLPKGVMVEHRNLLAVCAAWPALYPLGPQGVHLQMASFAFDVFSADLLRALAFGGRLVLCPHEQLLDPPALYRLLREQQVSFADFVPAVLNPLLAWADHAGENLAFLQTLVCGSDSWTAPQARLLRRVCGDRVRLFNAYGVTEATIDSSYCALDERLIEGAAVLPIGQPIANTRLYLLDAWDQPVPTGSVGQLHIGGAGVARGYLGRAQLTAERFIDSPFVAGDRLYRTGDLARYRPDGQLEFLGRNDFQAKVRGLRIELGEIEAQLANLDGVRDCLVQLREDSPGHPRLVAYFSTQPGHEPEVRTLRTQLAALLPDYMVPGAYVRLPALPLTANGKLDRTALPAPDGAALATSPYQPPQGPLETQLAAIWAALLEQPRVGRDDHFFALGGHSLLVMRVIAQVRQALGLEVPAAALFAAPRLADFAERVGASGAAVQPAIAVVDRQASLPLSFAQQRLWFLAQLDGASAAYHMPLGLRLRGHLDPAALHAALRRLVARHEALRTTFFALQGEAQQRIEPADCGFALPHHDLQGQADTESRLLAVAREEARTPFDLGAGPLIRGRLVSLAEDDHALLLTLHHIVSDGWSMGVLVRELGQLYSAFLNDQPDPLPALAVQYADYAAWQRQWLTAARLSEQSAYWRATLQGAPALLELPNDRPRPAVQDYRGGYLALELDPSLTARLKAFGLAQGSTLFMTLLAGWGLVLARLAGQQEVVVGTPSANRMRSELDGLIGFFVNTLALRLDLSDRPSVAQWLARVRQVALDAQAHQDLPFEQVVEQLNPLRSLAHSPLFQVLFAWEQDPGGELQLPDLRVECLDNPQPVAKFDLMLALSERDGRIVGGLEYATALFDAATVARFAEYFRRVLEQLVEDPARAVVDLDLLDPAQRQRILVAWNATQRDRHGVPGVVQRFEAQVARQPQALALQFEQQRLSYGELNQAANRLAHWLIGQGVRPDDRVGLCLERSPQMVVGLLAILKAGAAYVPFDPVYPPERLAYMFSDAAPKLLLTQAHLRAGPAAAMASGPRVCLDSEAAAWAGCASTNPVVAVLPGHLAYVLYTSGSSGWPKGVAHSRQALDNLIAWQLEDGPAEGPAPARVLQFASLNFDVSFQEICSGLCQGAGLVLLSAEDRQDLGRLRQVLVEQGVQRAFLPFAVLQQLVALSPADAPMPAGGCEIVTAGEALQVNDELRAYVRGLGGRYLYNQYGPTETHVVSQYALACERAGDWPGAPPIGRPIANVRLYVLDEALNPVPVGVVGELYIAGACLARGYLNRPELTAAAFLPDPFAGVPGARMYRSGDQVRWLADGNLQYLGRLDQQVKLRGFRIELGEIDSVLRRQPGVRDVAVSLEQDPGGEPRLVAYLVGEASPEALRKALPSQLPEHMIPTAWVPLAQLPLTANGKLDRRALPAVPAADGSATYSAPRTAAQAQMARIWAEVLKRESVGVLDNFFDLGGHSLLATRLVYAINQRMGAQLSLSSLFKTPRLADLAAQLEASRDTLAEREPDFAPLAVDLAGRYQPFPLTDIQQAYWFGREATVSLGGVSAHGYEELRIENFDAQRFERALNRLIARHDMLRAVFLSDGTQQVLEQVPAYRMPREDLRGLSAEVVAQRLEANRSRLSHQVLDASRWPLFEFGLTLLDDSLCHLHISLDALIVDAASSQILARELMAFYLEPDLVLAEPGLRYRDYVLAEHALRQSPRYERALAYWRGRVASLAPAPELPLVRQPESIERPHFTRRDRDMPAVQWTAIKAAAKQLGITPSVALLTAFSQVLALWSRQPRFTLSLPLFNRLPLHPEVDSLIGDFTSLVLLEVQMAGDRSFIEKARAIQEQLWQDIDHAAVSGVRVLRELSQARGAQQTAMPIVFNSTLSEAAVEQAEYNLTDALQAQNVHSITQTPQVWIDHTLLELEGRLLFNWDSIDELFPEGMVAQMFATYNRLLDCLAQPDAWQARTPELLPEVRLPAALAEPAPQPLLHELFEAQALATPQALAVIAPDRQLDYGELRQRARQLGAQLQARGAGPNQLVAVMMERGWEQVVATLAVLYAGAAYLPLDPNLPTERVAHILLRAEVTLVLTQSALGPRLQLPAAVSSIAVDQPASRQDGQLRPVAVAATDLAYVIYTSGSTGVPKGVMIDHRGAVNTLLDINRRFAVVPGDRVLAISSLSFDLSVYDLFGTLAAGAAVVLLAPEPALDPAHWLALIEAHGVSLWNSVPALLGMLVEYVETQGLGLPACLRLALLSGDWIPLTLPPRVHALRPALQLISLGGATEASIWSIGFPIDRVDPEWRSIPYGQALEHQCFHVLDDDLQQRPVGVPGQLYIGGIGLAQGYWRDAAQTQASFLVHPLSGERLYRTGDLGRQLADGQIEFLGREDNQVKVQGYRIELGEIEAALVRHPGIQTAVVRVLGSGQAEKRLAAYVLKADPELGAADLAQYLAGKLPGYMLPSSFTFLDSLPLSANGKVDKNRLPEPTLQAEEGPSLAIEGPLEQRLVAIVEGVLKRDGIAASANLLNLGATSIDIVRIGNALSSELQFRPHLAHLLAQPTLLNLLGLYRAHRAGSGQLAPAAPAAAPIEALIEDPEARQAFKAREPGRRAFAAPGLALARPSAAGFAQRFADYRSVRHFSPQPVANLAFAELLACLSQGRLEGQVKYQFPSAGGLYPIQAYLYVKAGRVEGVPGGAYYYDPQQHRLLALGEGRALDPETYDYFVNRPVFEAAAFALFFIGELAAIQPLYGERSLDFCHIEAGAMAQLLSMVAVEQRLGLCGMGSIDAAPLQALFELGASHRLIYSMVGGVRDEAVVGHPGEALGAGPADPDRDLEEIEV
ncbi:MAG: amino acid adenylation domain-containing protein [Pseudomonas sp.]|uniref:non-ribosomal peptide synthetase n=1 Tax=Pseudomonas sp. TaxID=306 RepID=UPI003390959B